MLQESFELECDRLSHVVDGVQFERLRWARTEGPMLARLVELVQSAIESRPDFQLVDEGSTADIKRFVLKVHSIRIVGLSLYLERSRVMMSIEPIERSRYQVRQAPPVSEEYQTIDERWMAAAMRELFSRVQAS